MGLVLTNNLSVVIHQENELYIAGVMLRGCQPARIPSLLLVLLWTEHLGREEK